MNITCPNCRQSAFRVLRSPVRMRRRGVRLCVCRGCGVRVETQTVITSLLQYDEETGRYTRRKFRADVE